MAAGLVEELLHLMADRKQRLGNARKGQGKLSPPRDMPPVTSFQVGLTSYFDHLPVVPSMGETILEIRALVICLPKHPHRHTQKCATNL
jgi:hypothetical protein